ncbi:MAG: hypothetical protein ABL971_08440 [Vicinamibacterales bacterium]
MIAALLGLVLPSASTWLLIRAVGLVASSESGALRAALAVAGGIGFSSITTFVFVCLGVRLGPGFVVADASVWVALGVLFWRMGRSRSGSPAVDGGEVASPPSSLDWLARGAFGLTTALAVATVWSHYLAAPHGEWDAWAIWNQKARFLFRAGDGWTDVLAIAWSNPSHPLLVSTSVARLWAYAGAELTAVPAVLSALYGALVVSAVVGALHARHARAWLAGAVVLAPAVFTQLAAAQTADLPAGLFILLSLIMLRGVPDADARRRTARWVAAGVLASLAGWTKNEGVVFLAITGGWILLGALRRGAVQRFGWWLAGAVPVLATTVWFKVAIAPEAPIYMSDPGTVAALVGRVFAVDRHVAIGSLVGRMAGRWGGPIASGALPGAMVASVLAAVRGSRAARFALGVIAPLFAAYWAVWVLTPLDTAWLVSTTFDRLVCQVWPALVLAAFSSGDSTVSRSDV